MESLKTTMIRVRLSCKIAGIEIIYSSVFSSPFHIPKSSCTGIENEQSFWLAKARVEFFLSIFAIFTDNKCRVWEAAG